MTWSDCNRRGAFRSSTGIERVPRVVADVA
jgi:hypothetical protein